MREAIELMEQEIPRSTGSQNQMISSASAKGFEPGLWSDSFPQPGINIIARQPIGSARTRRTAAA